MDFTKQKEDEVANTAPLSDSAQADSDSVDASRRRFSRSGLAVSGVLLTLASRAALGGGLVCNSPSGFISGNLSQHGEPKSCGGRTPGYWGTNTDNKHQWPLPYKTGTCTNTQKSQDHQSWSTTGATMFKDSSLGFNCTGNGAKYNNYSMMQVILLGGSADPYQLGAHCVSALLNARQGWTLGVLTETQVRDMFNEYASKGYFEPTSGVKWYPADIVTYLKSTMPL